MTTCKVHLQSLDLKKYKYPQQWYFKFFVWYLNFGNDPTHFRSWHLTSWLFYYQIYLKQKSQSENFGKLYKIELNVLFYFLGVNFLSFTPCWTYIYKNKIWEKSKKSNIKLKKIFVATFICVEKSTAKYAHTSVNPSWNYECWCYKKYWIYYFHFRFSCLTKHRSRRS